MSQLLAELETLVETPETPENLEWPRSFLHDPFFPVVAKLEAGGMGGALLCVFIYF